MSHRINVKIDGNTKKWRKGQKRSKSPLLLNVQKAGSGINKLYPYSGGPEQPGPINAGCFVLMIG